MFELKVHVCKKPKQIYFRHYLIYWETTAESHDIIPDTGVIVNRYTWKDKDYV